MRHVPNLSFCLPQPPIAFYTNPGSAFKSVKFKAAISDQGIAVVNAPVKPHRPVGLVEVSNKIAQSIINKTTKGVANLDENPSQVAKAMNMMFMQLVGFTPSVILMGLETWKVFATRPGGSEAWWHEDN
jgi:hypothetical protein